ncbi:MAG: L-piperidine-6-carboxylate dehydrogenase [Sphingobacterium sp.]
MIKKELKQLGIEAISKGTSTGNEWFANGNSLHSFSPVDGLEIGEVISTTKEDYEHVVETAIFAQKHWASIPAPKRGEIIRQFGEKLREQKPALGKLVSYEMGKSYQEGMGEVQEMIDICDFAVGISRQLYGNTIHSERPSHRMYDQYHPLGVVGIISAFNFPVAVWSWNTALALVCGDVVIWKGSEKTPLCSIACQRMLGEILHENQLPEGISSIITGDLNAGKWLSEDKRIPLISATGSTKMGKQVASTVASRLGKSLLELGGNNAIIVTPDADLHMTLIGAVFGAVGTAGQRCTSTRRLIIHESIYESVKESITAAYRQLKIGNPLNEENHMGPLIDKKAVDMYNQAISKIEEQGGILLTESGPINGDSNQSGCYVKPVIAEVQNHFEIVQTETFAPILYLIKYKGGVEDAISLQNSVVQGLSSAIMTNNLREAELFLSHAGSDCGIANVNIGTSGAEIGGAFGGEKETGGGRESGSDAWKIYMRRQTNTINYSTSLPLAQGISFNFNSK